MKSPPEPPHAASILLVDDTIENLRVLAGMLATRGFDARPVTSGAEALLAAAHELPDLVLLDVTMPGMNGFEVCEAMRATATTADVPIIFLTANAELEHKVRGFAVGGTDYITKPFQIEEVLARVSNQLALRRARQDLEATVRRLREAEQLRDDLVHMIVHDMRSPLTVLLAQLGLMELDATGEMADSVRAAADGARRLNQLASTLLDVTRLEEGKMPLTLALTDLGALAGQTRDAMAALEADRPISVATSGPATAMCDAGLIRRVLENLVSNAIKHTPRAGTVRLTVTTLASGVRVAVQDEGGGVPLEARERIFEKFGAVAMRKDSTYHSVGLGLAFCKLAVEAHGGTISVTDAEPTGSVFAFELPTGRGAGA